MTRILVADDSETVLLLLQRRLEMEGYEVSTARDGQEALDAVESGSGRPDLILLDAMMPNVSGVDALQRLRESGCEIPIVMISAHLDVQEPQRLQSLGANGTVPKPFDWDELIGRIEELV